MNIVALRASLRLLRNQSGKTWKDLGLDKSTIYRIENTKSGPEHEPTVTSIEKITTACGYTLVEFLQSVDGLTTALGEKAAVDLLSELREKRTVKQVQGFLRQPDVLRAGFAATPPPADTSELERPRTGGPTRGPKKARNTRLRSAQRPSSVRGKSDMKSNRDT